MPRRRPLPPPAVAAAVIVALATALVARAGQGTDPPSAHATPAFSLFAALGGYPVETLQAGNAWRGRQSPLAASSFVGLPYVLSNFQGKKKGDRCASARRRARNAWARAARGRLLPPQRSHARQAG